MDKAGIFLTIGLMTVYIIFTTSVEDKGYWWIHSIIGFAGGYSLSKWIRTD